MFTPIAQAAGARGSHGRSTCSPSLTCRSSPSTSALPTLLSQMANVQEAKQLATNRMPVFGCAPTQSSQPRTQWPHQQTPRCAAQQGANSQSKTALLSYTPSAGAPQTVAPRMVGAASFPASASTPRMNTGRATASRSFEVCDLQIGNQAFDPSNEAIKSQLVSKLGLSTNVTIEALQNSTGGLNEGTWRLRSASGHDLILKLVNASRGEGSRYLNLHRSHPGIAQDPVLAFPLKVFNCSGGRGSKQYDLVVMKRAPGKTLADFIGSKWYRQGADSIMRVVKKVGSALREMHHRYRNGQHGDFQPSNIFYDDATDTLMFIDIADLGAQQSHHNDKQHFLEALRILSRAYGTQFMIDASAAFEAGYRR